MGSISINGQTFVGNNIRISNGNLIVDGKSVDTKDEKIINITVEGNIQELDVDYAKSLKVTGNVGTFRNGSGDVEIIGNVTGGAQSGSGDITVKAEVNGNIQTGSGDVKCGSVSGSVRTGSGDIQNAK